MMLQPGWLDTCTVTGVMVSHEFLSWGMPPTVRLTIRIVIFDVVATAPVEAFTVPIVGPSLMSWAVAVTGTGVQVP